jgi:hypothetical protein
VLPRALVELFAGNPQEQFLAVLRILAPLPDRAI